MSPLLATLRRPLDGLARLTLAPGAPLDGASTTVPTDLLAARNIALMTYERDGSASTHPVWFSVHEDRIWVITSADAFKVRHLRRDPRALIAPCRRLGTPTGPAVPATGQVLDREEAPDAWAAVAGRYGWQLAMFVRSERRNGRGQVLLAFDLAAGRDDHAPPPADAAPTGENSS